MTAAVARSRTSTSGSGRIGRSTASARADQSRQRSASSPANVIRPHLRVLDQQALRRRARRRNLAMAMFVVLIIGFFAAALAQAQLVANQHELDLLRTQIAEAEANRARLERSVEESSAPGAIIDRAVAIGMVRANDPIYLAAVGPAPEVIPISVLGAVTASTGDPDSTLVMIAAPAAGSDSATATAVSAMAVTADGRSRSAAGAAGDQLAAPLLAGLAGTRAVATGIGTG